VPNKPEQKRREPDAWRQFDKYDRNVAVLNGQAAAHKVFLPRSGNMSHPGLRQSSPVRQPKLTPEEEDFRFTAVSLISSR